MFYGWASNWSAGIYRRTQSRDFNVHKMSLFIATAALIDVLLISVKLFVGFHQVNHVASKIENVIDLLRFENGLSNKYHTLLF